MTTDRHIEVYRLHRLHGCTLRETGEMIEPSLSTTRVWELLQEVYDEYPDLKPESIKHEIISYDDEMDFRVIETF